MVEDYISLFAHIYWSAIVMNAIALIMGVMVIGVHGATFKASCPRDLFKSPIEWLYWITVLSTIGNMVIIWALIEYVQGGHIGTLPSKRESMFAFYHALQGVAVIGWHILSYIILKLYRRKGC